MSLILEALKKSEQQRRLGEAPTFGSPVVATRKRRSLVPLIAILIVAAGGVWWWLDHRAAAPAPEASAPVASTKPVETPLAQQVQKRPAAASARPAPTRTPPAANAAAAANPDKRAVGVGNVPHASTVAPQAPAAPDKNAGLRAPAPAVPAKTDTAATAPAAAVPKTAATQPAATQPAATPPAATAPVAPTRQQPPAAAAADTKPAAAAPPAAAVPTLPTVWDLPYATRKDIPAIELSMHVYSSDPKQRFVVIKGDRHGEGDEVGADLVLKEIRQDGIVLDYKGQVFFYPRSGR